jgi:hypothetical protein
MTIKDVLTTPLGARDKNPNIEYRIYMIYFTRLENNF